MNKHLQHILSSIQENNNLPEAEKNALIKSLKDADKELEIANFKLDRTEKVKRTTAILLEETIEELEQKRKAVEAQNRTLEIEAAVERVRTASMAMQQTIDLEKVNQELYSQLNKLTIPGFTGVAIYLVDDEGIVTVWDLSSPGSIATANSYAFTYDPAKCPTLGEFVQLWKLGEQEYFVLDYPAEKLLQVAAELEPAYPAMADNFRNAVRSGALTHQWNAAGEISHGMLSLDLMMPPTEEIKSITIKMAGAFNLAYQRFHDLQKAERQAQEARIEAALEKIRSRSLAMHQSGELKDVIQIMFERLRMLDVLIGTVGIWLFDKNTMNSVFWVGNDLQAPAMVNLPYDERLMKEDNNNYRDSWEAWMSGKNYINKAYEQQQKNRYFEYVFANNDFDTIPAAARETILQAPSHIATIITQKNSALFADSWNGNIYSEDSINILTRTAKVFEQAYVRFLDLQKAEAQTKEAQIEMALEKVRARTMAMQHSDELADASFVLDTQVRELGIQTRGCAFNIYGEESSTEWFSSEQGTMPVYKTPREGLFLRYLEAGQRGEKLYIESFSKAACAAHYQYLLTIPVMGDALKEMIAAGGSFPEKQVDHVVYFKYGYLLFITLEPMPEAHDVFIRFAHIFEQTYTRFLDLQKAEAQAKEAQIEAALERVRSRTLAMQQSAELAETAAVLFQQLILLGIEPNRLYISIIKDDSGASEFWITDEDGTRVSTAFFANLNDNPSFAKMLEGWKQQQKSLIIDMQGEELDIYFRFLTQLGIPFKGGLSQKRRVQEVAYFSQGFIGIASAEEQSIETLQLLERFAAVFNLTFTRFNDLKIAEAHAVQAELDLVVIKEARQKAEKALSELQAAQKQLIQSEKMASLGELTAGIAHEIQNPLNFVNNFSEVSRELIDELKNQKSILTIEEQEELLNDIDSNLEKINHHGKRADGIVKGMLQHSRTSSGQQELTDINGLCDEYLRLSYHGLRAKDKLFNATLKTDFDTTIEKIQVAPQDIGRVVMNLLTNAFYAVNEKKKSAAAGYEPQVMLSTKQLANSIEVRVHDNGGGIPAGIVEKIFQPFFTTKPTGQGTGLGLSLAYDIMKAHGGELQVLTKEGEGSEFIVKLLAATRQA